MDQLDFGDEKGHLRACLGIRLVRALRTNMQTLAGEVDLNLQRLQQIMEFKPEGEDE